MDLDIIYSYVLGIPNQVANLNWSWDDWRIWTVIYLVLVVLIVYIVKLLGKGKQGMPKEREVADAIVNAIEDLKFRGVLSKFEAIRWYRYLARAMRMSDLRPRNAEELKHAIRKRVEKEFGKSKLEALDLRRKQKTEPANDLGSILVKYATK